jgi:hypothetical protein
MTLLMISIICSSPSDSRTNSVKTLIAPWTAFALPD